MVNRVRDRAQDQGFPTSAIYTSESGSDSRVPGLYGKTFAVTGNTFINNWGGVILWENSNRYCNSPANTSLGYCTLVAPSTITTTSCNAKNVAHAPYYDDCRWKTQNVTVSHNRFITEQQNNHFTASTYTGPWRFTALAEGDTISGSTWRAVPY